MSEKIDLTDDFEGMSEEELFSFDEHDKSEAEKITAPRYSYWKSVFRVFFKKKINIVMLAILLILVVFAFVYPLFSGYDRFAYITDASMKHLTPSASIAKNGFSIHEVLGRGGSGESTFDAVWNGARISISFAFVCGIINMLIGVIIGAIWGFSKKFDLFMMEVYNIIGNVPLTLVVAVLVRVLSPGFWTMVFALTVTGWLFIAYFFRTQVIIIRDREYNLASRCLGTSIFKIAIRNILPFMTSLIVTLAAAEIPSYISYEVFLAYIGMGMADMSLGRLIYQYESSMSIAGWQFEFWSPVIIVSIITVVLYVVGQNLGDASDPRTHM